MLEVGGVSRDDGVAGPLAQVSLAKSRTAVRALEPFLELATECVLAGAEQRGGLRVVRKRMLPGRGLASRPGNGGGEHQYVKLRF
jgi:hypothetical protein